MSTSSFVTLPSDAIDFTEFLQTYAQERPPQPVWWVVLLVSSKNEAHTTLQSTCDLQRYLHRQSEWQLGVAFRIGTSHEDAETFIALIGGAHDDIRQIRGVIPRSASGDILSTKYNIKAWGDRSLIFGIPDVEELLEQLPLVI